MSVISALGADIEIRNIWEDAEHETSLVAATRRTVVPVLYYEDEGGNENWMPESGDIINFLNNQYR